MGKEEIRLPTDCVLAKPRYCGVNQGVILTGGLFEYLPERKSIAHLKQQITG